MPTTARICYSPGNGTYQDITIAIEALATHRAHGDIVPGVDTTDCGCPAPGQMHSQ